MGIEPTDAARWRGNWPRLSFTLALHLWAIRVRIVEMLFLEVAKWRAFYGINVNLVSYAICVCIRWCDGGSQYLASDTFDVDVRPLL